MLTYLTGKTIANYAKNTKYDKKETQIPYLSLTQGIYPQLHEGPGTSFQRQRDANQVIKKIKQNYNGDLKKAMADKTMKQEIFEKGWRNSADLASFRHDADYTYIDAKDKKQKQEMIDKADDRFMKNQMKEWWNPNNVIAGVSMKYFKNKIGDHILNKAATDYGGYENMPQEDKDILNENKEWLESQGYGLYLRMRMGEKYGKIDEDLIDYLIQQKGKGLVGRGFWEDFNGYFDTINKYTFDQVRSIPVVGSLAQAAKTGFNLPNHLINLVANSGHRTEALKNTLNDVVDIAKIAVQP